MINAGLLPKRWRAHAVLAAGVRFRRSGPNDCRFDGVPHRQHFRHRGISELRSFLVVVHISCSAWRARGVGPFRSGEHHSRHSDRVGCFHFVYVDCHLSAWPRRCGGYFSPCGSPFSFSALATCWACMPYWWPEAGSVLCAGLLAAFYTSFCLGDKFHVAGKTVLSLGGALKLHRKRRGRRYGSTPQPAPRHRPLRQSAPCEVRELRGQAG